VPDLREPRLPGHGAPGPGRPRRPVRLLTLQRHHEMAKALLGLVPEVLVPAAVEKLRFVHRLIRESRRPPG